jgi:uncharacterized membrane protein YfcA
MEKDILILCIGVVVGAMNAVAGGGMLIGFPALVALGVPPLAASITGTAITPPGQLAAVGAYRHYLRRIPLRYAYLLLPVALGAFAGATTLRHTSDSHFAQLVPWLVLFGVVLFAFQPLIHVQLHRHIHSRRRRPDRTLWFIGAAILPASFYGGYFGAGYGFLMLAFLGFGKVHEIHALAAMKNLSAATCALISLLCLYSTGLINWHIAAVMAVGTTAGGYLGAHAAKRVSTHWLRVFVIATGLLAAAYLALK